MTTKTILRAFVLVGVVAASMSTLAATIPLASDSTGGFDGSIDMAANGLVIDDFSFTPESFGGLVSVTLSNLSGPVSFFTAAFIPDTSSEIDFSNLSNDPSADFSFSALVSSAMPLTLRVFGAVTQPDGNPGGAGTYHVAVTEAIAAVPEPQTYALLLAGLAATSVGVARRRTRRI